jgi:HTH-type transcriptional regulator/antitoxin HigA
MQNLGVPKTTSAWSSLADTIFVPHSEHEYRQLVGLLDRLVDEVGEDESDPAGFSDGDCGRAGPELRG